MKNTLNAMKTLTLVCTLALAGAPAFAGDNNGGGNNGGADAQSYTVKVYLSRQDGVQGELEVIDNNTNQVIKTCPAIGGRNNHPDGNPSRPTPSGRSRVDRTSPHLDYMGQANAIRNVNATYFASIFGRPVAVHTGNLNSNSHACVRTTAACSSYIKAKADASKNGNRYNMWVDVSYVR